MSGDRLSSASTIDGILWSAAEECPRNVALTTGLESVSFEVLRSKVESFAHYLETRGVLVGQTVALLMENSLEFVIAHYAVCAIGGVVAPRSLPSSEVRRLSRHWAAVRLAISSRPGSSSRRPWQQGEQRRAPSLSIC